VHIRAGSCYAGAVYAWCNSEPKSQRGEFRAFLSSGARRGMAVGPSAAEGTDQAVLWDCCAISQHSANIARLPIAACRTGGAFL
jgi:hypothetical protein